MNDQLRKLAKNQEFIYILHKIQEVLPTTIITGGAIRDVYHNKPVKDIDIFVQDVTFKHNDRTCSVYDEDFWLSIFGLEDTEDYIEDGGVGSCAENENHIESVWEIRNNGILYNIVIVNLDPVEYVNRFFDVGLCKAYCDGKRIRLTADFMRDSQNKTLTVVSEKMTVNDFAYMMNNHVDRLQAKYPDYKLVIPPKYTEYYKEFADTI